MEAGSEIVYSAGAGRASTTRNTSPRPVSPGPRRCGMAPFGEEAPSKG